MKVSQSFSEMGIDRLFLLFPLKGGGLININNLRTRGSAFWQKVDQFVYKKPLKKGFFFFMANRYWLLLIFLGAIWGSAFMFIKIATPDLGPVFLVNIRLFIAGLMFLPILLQSKYLKLLRSNLRNILFLAVINNALPFTLFSYASLCLLYTSPSPRDY